MREYDVIRALNQGDLRPDTDFAITMDAFTIHEKRLRENMDGESGKRFEELIAIQEISKEYQRQKTNQCSPMDGSARRLQQYLAEAGVIT